MMLGDLERRRCRRYIEALIEAKGDIALAARRLHCAKAVVRLTLREIETAFAINFGATAAVPLQRIGLAELVRALQGLDTPQSTA